MCIFEGDLVESSVVHTNSGSTIGLLYEDEGETPRGLQFRYNTILEVFIKEFLNLLKIR